MTIIHLFNNIICLYTATLAMNDCLFKLMLYIICVYTGILAMNDCLFKLRINLMINLLRGFTFMTAMFNMFKIECNWLFLIEIQYLEP